MLNKLASIVGKVFRIIRRDGVRITLQKIISRCAVYMKSRCPNIKSWLPIGVKEWLWCRLERPLPVVEKRPFSPDMPLVAIIIPCYNYGKYLPEAVESALQQTLENKEIIIVNDGSTDALTLSVLKEMEKKDGVKVIHQHNKGLSAARNIGIHAACARYITCLDADDFIDPTYLEKTVTVLEARPDVGLAYSYAQLFGDVQELWYTESMDPAKLLRYNHIPVVAVFRREAWEKAGGYDEEMRIGYEDWDFWLRLAALGYRGFLIPEPLFKHRRHGKTMTHRAQEKHLQLSTNLRHKYGKVTEIKPLRAEEVTPGQAFANIRACKKQPGFKRLLVLVPWLNIGGAENVLNQVLRSFSETEKWEVYIITTLESSNEWADRFAAITPFIYFLPHLMSRRSYTDWVIAFIKRHDIDVVLISHSRWAYLALEKIKLVLPMVMVVDLLHNEGRDGYTPTSAKQDKFIDGHIVVHQGIKSKLVHDFGLCDEKIFTIPNGVDSEKFRPRIDDRNNLKQKLDLNPSNLHVAFVGRYSQEKNPMLFIQLAAQLRNIPGVEWLCFGDGELKTQLEADAVKKHSPVIFMGSGHCMSDVFNAMDLLVLTSNSEGLPLVVIEALMCGVPGVATNVGCLDIIIEPGVNGYLVKKNDIEELSCVVKQLLKSPDELNKLKQNCRNSVVNKYSGREMGRRYVELLEILLAQKQ